MKQTGYYDCILLSAFGTFLYSKMNLRILSKVLITLFAINFFHVNSNVLQKLSPELVVRLEKGEKVNVFISFIGGIESTLLAFRQHVDDSSSDRSENKRKIQLEFLRESLIENAKIAQTNVYNLLTRRNSKGVFGNFKSYWITNQIFIEKADSAILYEVGQDPKVKNIREEGYVYLLTPESWGKVDGKLTSRSNTNNTIPWGIQKIQAPESWSLAGNNKGEGVIVATIDTGVRHTHEALVTNFLGEYGWYDPSKSQDTPFDVIGHGTHVTATIVGRYGIGVAPGAKWATCVMCSKDLNCPPRYTLECGQFFVCPTLPDGSKPDCTKTPRVISNAWGSLMVEEWTDMIKVWHAAGIIPVFALGNSGPTCGSTYFPGNHSDVIAVGNTNSEDALNLTSSVGPTTDGRIKPDIVAPGTDIFSASFKSDNAYHVATGTSMAAPHVAGAIALLLGKQRNLSYQQVKALLFDNTDRDGLSFGKNACQATNLMKFPNNLFGYGRLNVYNALKIAH